jgi:cardiolipin synthase
MIWFITATYLFILQIGFVLFFGFRNPSKTMAWLTITYLIPLVGFMLYFVMATDYRMAPTLNRRNSKKPLLSSQLSEHISVSRWNHFSNRHAGRQERLIGFMQSIPEAPLTECNEIQVYNNGEDTFESIIHALNRAKHHIHMEYFIIRNDQIGRKIQQILIDRAKQGVQVRVVIDGLGSHELKHSFLDEWKHAGVNVQIFSPLRKSMLRKQVNYRNHRKIIVIDGLIGFLGGTNIGDEYLGRSSKFGFWRDTHMRIRGDAVFFLQHTFLNDWLAVSGEQVVSRQLFPQHACVGQAQIQIIPSGPDTDGDSIHEFYFSAFNASHQSISIVTPYFIPDRSLMMALKTAALSGVKVKIIIPEIEDHFLVKWAAYSYMEELMHAGVRFYKYTKGFIHAKIVIIDRTIASVGTANMDMRSLFDNFELNAAIFDEPTIEKLAQDFHEDITNSNEILMAEFCNRPLHQKGKEILARMVSSLL